MNNSNDKWSHFIYLLVSILVCAILGACSFSGAKSDSSESQFIISDDDRMLLNLPENIKRITVTGLLEGEFSYTDDDKIASLLEYLSTLELDSTSKTDEEMSEYNGGGWIIDIVTDKETISLNHFGNSFIRTPDAKWWSISYDQAKQFQPLIRSMIPDVFPRYTIAYDEWKTGQVSAEAIGLTMNVDRPNALGVTLVFTQSGGSVQGKLSTGSFLELEIMDENGEWSLVEYAKDNEWNDLVFDIDLNTTTQLAAFWSTMYGTMPDGHYRIHKIIRDTSDTGNYEEYDLYAEFIIADEAIKEARGW